MINEKRHVRNPPWRSHLPMCRWLTFRSRPHVAPYPNHVANIGNSFQPCNTLPTFRTIFPTFGGIKNKTLRQLVLMECFRQKFAKNLLKTKQTLIGSKRTRYISRSRFSPPMPPSRKREERPHDGHRCTLYLYQGRPEWQEREWYQTLLQPSGNQSRFSSMNLYSSRIFVAPRLT